MRLEGDLVEKAVRRFDPTIEELRRIRAYTSTLLPTRTIRQILPLSIESVTDLHYLFDRMLNRIKQRKTPQYFVKVFSLFQKWRRYIMVSFKDEEIAKNVLQYHLMNLKGQNDLYECWIFCKILYAIAQTHTLKLVEVHSSRGGLVDFKANDGLFHIIYQDFKWKVWHIHSF
jgi:hypothetical protein